jgi:hypothetical protein
MRQATLEGRLVLFFDSERTPLFPSPFGGLYEVLSFVSFSGPITMPFCVRAVDEPPETPVLGRFV